MWITVNCNMMKLVLSGFLSSSFMFYQKIKELLGCSITINGFNFVGYILTPAVHQVLKYTPKLNRSTQS